MKKMIFLGVLCLALTMVVFTSCSKDDPPAAPSISITPIDTAAGTGETVTYKIHVTAGAGLTSVKLNNVDIKSYTDGKKADDFTFAYTYTETTATTLIFSVTDKSGVIATANGQVGWRLPQSYYIFKLDEQTAIDSADLCEGWFCGKFPVLKFGHSDIATNGLLWQRGIDIDETVTTGVQAPGGGVAMKVDRTNTPWGGWSMYMFNFPGKNFPLPEMAGLKDGSRVLAMDVYFEEKETNPAFSFQAMSDSVYKNNDASIPIKVKGGIKFQIRLLNTNKWVANQNVLSYIHEAYLTKKGEWQTIYFNIDEAETEVIGKALTKGSITTKVLDSEVDGFLLILNYQSGADKNNYYIRNIRFSYPK